MELLAGCIALTIRRRLLAWCSARQRMGSISRCCLARQARDFLGKLDLFRKAASKAVSRRFQKHSWTSYTMGNRHGQTTMLMTGRRGYLIMWIAWTVTLAASAGSRGAIS